jgi:hypothetical protein
MKKQFLLAVPVDCGLKVFRARFQLTMTVVVRWIVVIWKLPKSPSSGRSAAIGVQVYFR